MCQKYRIDIKKPLDEAAKMVEPFVTGDALMQQLAKRRTRYLSERDDVKQEPAVPTPRSNKKVKTAAAVVIDSSSPDSGKKATPVCALHVIASLILQLC